MSKNTLINSFWTQSKNFVKIDFLGPKGLKHLKNVKNRFFRKIALWRNWVISGTKMTIFDFLVFKIENFGVENPYKHVSVDFGEFWKNRKKKRVD